MPEPRPEPINTFQNSPENLELTQTSSCPIRAVLIDDQPIIGEAVRRILATESDISFHYCADPAIALSVIKEVRPTVIFLDLVMPEIDGLILAKFLRANTGTCEIPLVMLSSKEEPKLKAEAFNLGANDYLVKLPDKLEFIARTRYHSNAYSNRQDLKVATTQAQLQAQQLAKALEELQKAQSQMIQSEKMSSLGQLVAGIAHEINNPVSFIHGNLLYLEQYVADLLRMLNLYEIRHFSDDSEIKTLKREIDLEFLLEDLPTMMKSMKNGTNRIRDIILSLRNFSRMDQSEFKVVDIHEGLESTLLILQHRLDPNANNAGIRVTKDYGHLPLVECSPGQINQVFMNILLNAIDAIESSYTSPINVSSEPTNVDTLLKPQEVISKEITIRTSQIADDWVQVVITDNGLGMTEDVKQYIFNPFFTTKAIGKGMGMGLSISYQIITDQHNGRLECLSQPNRGTQFIIEIPIHHEILIG
ncbi:MAG: response regulator [Coleofasciculaceae cyanobacterium SM2_1_6]|nr:response regulator [Coleofasciculaceae cyanobacterium SM2_1_6]